MDYRQRRHRAKLTAYTVAKKLGISYEKYLEVEKGKRNLEGDLIDNFVEIMKRSKEIAFNRKQTMVDINNWIADGTIEKDMVKQNYNQSSLARKMGVKFPTINLLIHKSIGSDDLKERVYDLLHDPLEKNIEDNVKKLKEKVKEPEVIEQVVEAKKPIVVEAKDTSIEKLEEEIKALKRQIMIYEKLIMKL